MTGELHFVLAGLRFYRPSYEIYSGDGGVVMEVRIPLENELQTC